MENIVWTKQALPEAMRHLRDQGILDDGGAAEQRSQDEQEELPSSELFCDSRATYVL